MILRVFLFSLAISISLPTHAKIFGRQCAYLFQPHGLEALPSSDMRVSLLKSALGETKINLTQDVAYLEKIMRKWDLRNSTPYHIEMIAQRLVMKKDREPSDNFLEWLKYILKRESPEKELMRVVYETQLLKEELLQRLEIYGYKKENSKWDNFRDLSHKHYYKSKLTRLVAVNLAIAGAVYGAVNYVLPGFDIPYYKFIYPVYFPLINPIQALKPNSVELDLVKRVGFDTAYPTLKDNHKVATNIVPVIRRMPYVLVLGVAGYLGYNYYSFKAMELETKEVQENLEIGRIPYTHPLYKDWRRDFIIENQREPDMNNPKDKESWELIEEVTYTLWKESFEAQYHRAPNLKNKEDLMAWQEFLAGIQSPQ